MSPECDNTTANVLFGVLIVMMTLLMASVATSIRIYQSRRKHATDS